jgi:hypothetical protein
MLTITDCLLWKGEETYIDVHITNTTAALHNRDSSIGRELTSEFYKTPFRQFEDHGICFNSCVEKWEDDLVAQAFGRASVLSPELYGTFFFLGDEDYPRLARLIQLHKRSEPMLKKAFPLSDGDIAHGDGRSSLIVLRNPTWAYRTKSVPLDGTIGLAAAPGTPLTVRQRHPREFLVSKQGIKAGESLRIELEPFDVQMIQVELLLDQERKTRRHDLPASRTKRMAGESRGVLRRAFRRGPRRSPGRAPPCHSSNAAQRAAAASPAYSGSKRRPLELLRGMSRRQGEI